MKTFLLALRHFLCGLHGHDRLVQFKPDRMFLLCVSCGHTTKGWDLSDPTPVTLRPRLVRFRKRQRVAA